MTARADAVARLDGATATHMLSKPVADVFWLLLRDHPEDCEGTRHLQGDAKCRHYRALLAALGIGGAV